MSYGSVLGIQVLNGGFTCLSDLIDIASLGIKSEDIITVDSVGEIQCFDANKNYVTTGRGGINVSFAIPENITYINFRHNTDGVTIPTSIVFNGKKYVYKVVDTQNIYSYNTADELAYLRESFELRHPDEDDVAEDWGFMGVDEEVNCVRYYNYTGIGYYVLSQIPRDGRDSVVIETGNKCGFGLSIHDANMEWLRNDFSTTNERPYTFSEFEQYFSVIIPNSENIQDVSYIMVDGSKYFIDEEVFVDDTGLPYVGSFKKEGTGLKALIDWVDNCTDEEFVNDFEEHFHKDYTLRYFCLVTLVGAVDNLG
jgi:hypothetical protein